MPRGLGRGGELKLQIDRYMREGHLIMIIIIIIIIIIIVIIVIIITIIIALG